MVPFKKSGGSRYLETIKYVDLIRRLSLNVLRTGTICKAAFIRAEEASDILADISDRRCTLTVGVSKDGHVRRS